MFDLHRDYLMTMHIEERRAEAQRRGELRNALRNQQAAPRAIDRMLGAVGSGLVRAGEYLQRRAQVVSNATLLLR